MEIIGTTLVSVRIVPFKNNWKAILLSHKRVRCLN